MIRIKKWFELKFGWFFVNGFKQQEWHEYLEMKYSKKKTI